MDEVSKQLTLTPYMDEGVSPDGLPTIKNIPFVIDNQQYTMRDVLNSLLVRHQGHALDIATAYFNVGGWQLLREGMDGLSSFRLLLGDEPEVGADLGLREAGAKPVKGLIRELDEASFNEKTLQMIEGLIAFLRQEHVLVRLYTKTFLHAKCYLFYGDSDLVRLAPDTAIVGSSNFTRAGLFTSRELNLVHRATLAAEEVAPERVKGIMESRDRKSLAQIDEEQRTYAANVPGLLAMHQLNEWYERCWKRCAHDTFEFLALGA
jgi:phosphatidylserine/phosphatidylglycerophosphate/cardiolipin synthase-like enzyme